MLRQWWIRQVITVCLGLLILCTGFARAEESDDRVKQITSGWSYRWGDSPNENGNFTWLRPSESANWHDVSSPTQIPGREGNEFLWLRLMVPSLERPDLSLLLHSVDLRFEAYTDKGLHYRFGDLNNPADRRPAGYPLHFLPLPKEMSGKPLYFRIFSNHQNIGFFKTPEIGSKGTLVLQMVSKDIWRLVVAAILLGAGLLSGLIFAKNLTQRAYLAFFSLSVCAGLWILMRSFLIHLFVGNQLLVMSVELIALYMVPVGYVMFVHWTFAPGKLMQTIAVIFIVYSVATVVFALSGGNIQATLGWYQMLAAVAILVVIGYSAVHAFRGSREALLFTVGISISLLGNLLDILTAVRVIPLQTEFSYWGFLLFVSFLGSILVMRFVEMQRQIRLFTAELQEKNERLSRLDKLKDQFLANTSHELRTPIVGIMGIAESLIQGAAGPLSEGLKKNLALVVYSARRLSSLVNDILDFSKFKEEKIQLKREPVRLFGIVETVTAMSVPLIGKKDLSLQNLVPREMKCIDADSNRLQQVLYNLVANAIKFSESGHVVVSAECAGGMITVCVSDTGLGIPAEKFASIFQPFEQGDASTTRKFGGTGLGLSVSKQIVELHGGKIWLESEVGKGSKFFFSIAATEAVPTARADEVLERTAHVDDVKIDATLAELHEVHQDDESAALVLIVDDEPVNRQVLRNQLQLAGYRLLEADSGKEALRVLSANPEIGLILLDVMMPEMSGYDVCQEIRRNWSMDALPIIFLTAKTQLSNLVEGFSSGGNDYLMKPFFANELLSRVRANLKLSAAARSVRAANLRLETAQRVTHAMLQSDDFVQIFSHAVGALIQNLSPAVDGKFTCSAFLCSHLTRGRANSLSFDFFGCEKVDRNARGGDDAVENVNWQSVPDLPPVIYQREPVYADRSCVLPLWVQETAVGALEIIGPLKRTLTPEDKVFLELIQKALAATLQSRSKLTDVLQASSLTGGAV